MVERVKVCKGCEVGEEERTKTGREKSRRREKEGGGLKRDTESSQLEEHYEKRTRGTSDRS